MQKANTYNIPRKNCKDLWNSFMVKNTFMENLDIPRFTGSSTIPSKLISYAEAKTIYNKMIINDKNFHFDAFVHFFIDDQVFDGKRNSIWTYPNIALNIIKHFSGIIAPDFSTYVDFPYPINIFNLYRSRAFGFWLTKQNIEVIHNVRWGYKDTWKYCFNGIPKGSTVCIGTVASGLRKCNNRSLFENGFLQMLHTIQPKTNIIYG